MIARMPAVGEEDAGEMVPLSFLQAGESGRVGDVSGNVDLVHRLREMGLCDGATVWMIQPGSPCIIGLDGHRLCFRCDDLARVFVQIPAAG